MGKIRVNSSYRPCSDHPDPLRAVMQHCSSEQSEFLDERDNKVFKMAVMGIILNNIRLKISTKNKY